MAAKKPARHNTAWTDKDVQQLRKEAAGNTPTRVIALHLERTEDAVRAEASKLGLSLNPPNQPPDKRRKKA